MPSVTDAETNKRTHRKQLLVCHQKIAGRHYPGGHTKEEAQFCDLSAYAWCFTCDLYVCDIHLASRHDSHDTKIEFPRQTFTPGLPQGRMQRHD
jgi:hypothetical protein